MSISPHWEIHNFWCISACGNAPSNVNFQLEKRISTCADLRIFLCISTSGNLLKTVQIRICRNTLFLMREFSLSSISTHVVIHQTLCKSAQRKYTFSGAFPQVEIHNYKCMSSYAENQILVNFLVFIQMR